MPAYSYSANSQHLLEKFSTLIDLLRYRALHQADQTSFTFLPDGETEVASLTYQELDRQARAIAAQLQLLEATGSRALLLYPFSATLEFIAALFGCFYAGVVAVPTHVPRPNQSSRLQGFVVDAQVTLVLTTTSAIANLDPGNTQNPQLAALRWLATDNITSSLAESWQEPMVSSDTLAYLQYTSGSTGKPKGVMVSHGNTLHNSAMIYQFFGHTSNSRGAIWLPLYHDMGLIGGVLQPIYGGFSVILIPPGALLQKPVRWLQAISRYQATTSGGPNFAYEVACQRITPEQRANLDLSSWEVAFNGAEPVRAETLERFTATFEPCGFRREAFYPCYGMAETTSFLCGGVKTAAPIIQHVDRAALEQNRVAIATQSQAGIRRLVACGQIGLDQKIAIVDPESLTQCPADRVGEIWVSSPSVGKGYWNRPEQTEQAFNAYLADSDEGPFLRTGDLGFLLNGELFITGRLKDMMIVWGRNHYPQNIELTVEQSHPALRPSAGAAFALEVNGEEQLVVAQEVERSYLRKLNVEQVIEAIRQAIAEQHMVEVYAVLLLRTGSIPKTSSGKIQRQTCRICFLERSLDIVGEWQHHQVNQSSALKLLIDSES
ncbi:fatty acyl-AMP ligase [Chroococcidiopsis sp. CCMEE 29]|uniref:fatty acyl-AMP ligase n=1 Tax=Chroococcidiopsis sp. CCMEE 29 TaxID=155894 RepID=UPI002021512F|nr:fatty acyl-AMP ligase [Chroococcidiopsis sp. CCMEE 29]